jgi:hypothetical protein
MMAFRLLRTLSLNAHLRKGLILLLAGVHTLLGGVETTHRSEEESPVTGTVRRLEGASVLILSTGLLLPCSLQVISILAVWCLIFELDF